MRWISLCASVWCRIFVHQAKPLFSDRAKMLESIDPSLQTTVNLKHLYQVWSWHWIISLNLYPKGVSNNYWNYSLKQYASWVFWEQSCILFPSTKPNCYPHLYCQPNNYWDRGNPLIPYPPSKFWVTKDFKKVASLTQWYWTMKIYMGFVGGVSMRHWPKELESC